MNLGDPELELIDPTPNVHALFIQFDKTFFWAKLASRAVVRWSKRMYSCAGVCSYEGRGGLCDIALSEPLLKLRPRKDLIETLLHEMIHAYLFITLRVQDRDGHGPNFQEHMFRINKAAGINISIYHNFHDEVRLYQTHWWRCDGPCQFQKPHFGVVRRFVNSAPGPRDYWWVDHQRKCGGTFVKFKEPEKINAPSKKTVVAKPQGDITKYITNIRKTTIPPLGEPKIIEIHDIKSIPKVQIKSNNSSTVVITQKGVNSPTNVPAVKASPITAGKGYTLTGTRVRSHSADVSETVRNIWAKKQLTPKTVSPVTEIRKNNSNHYVHKPTTANFTPNNEQVSGNENNNIIQKAVKHKIHSGHVNSPPVKVKKIDDYFKANATSLLKDIYGTNIEVVESNNNKKLIAVDHTTTSSSQVVLVDCPICRLKIEESKINNHLDECLNKDLIAEICNGTQIAAPTFQGKIEPTVNAPLGNDRKPPNSVVNKVSPQVSTEILAGLAIPPYKPKHPHTSLIIKEPSSLNDNLNWNDHLKPLIPKTKFDPAYVQKVQFDKHIRKSDNFIAPKEEQDLGSDCLPSTSEDAEAIKLPPIKTEPGASTVTALKEQKCPCCGNKVAKAIDEHLDECLAFLATDPAPEEASTSLANHAIVIDDDDDDIFDESQLFNATGTKLPCPCCLEMVENDDMNAHLDSCLS